MIGRLLLVWRTIGRTFGTWFRPIGTFCMWCFLRLVVGTGMLCDVLFSSRYRKARIERPIVIVGNPRTGTTFLQRFLDKQKVGTGAELWGLLFPSVTLRTLLKPLLPTLEKVSPAKHHAAAAHKTSLGSVETDDVAVLFRYLDGFFLYGFFLAFHEQDLIDMVHPAKRDTTGRDFAWLRKVWRRNLAWAGGTRPLAKLFSLSPRVNSFLAAFPDAKVLYMVRDPISVVPSGMSLVTGVLDAAFGFWKLPEDLRKRYLERLYNAFLELSRTFHDDWVAGRISREQVMIVEYGRMMEDFEGLMAELLPFVGHDPSEALQAEIAKTAAKQRAWKSEHAYDLARFGLTEERILTDYAFMYDTFGIRRNEGDASAG